MLLNIKKEKFSDDDVNLSVNIPLRKNLNNNKTELLVLSDSSSDIEVDDKKNFKKKYINSLHKNEIDLNVSDNEFSTISEKHKSVKEVLNKKKLKDLNEIDN